MSDVPGALWVVGAVMVVLVLVVVVDIARSEVRHLPRWAWALIAVFVSFPIGAIVYLMVGRVPRRERTRVGGSTDGGVVTSVPELRHAVPTATSRAVSPGTGDMLAIETRGVSKVYGETVALADVDLAVPAGSTYGLIGPNGSGKTTMLSILAGLRRPSTGTVELAVDRRRMGLLVDTPQFEPWLSAREVVDLARHLTAPDVPTERVVDVLAEVGLGDVVDRRTGGFSRGMLQRLGLAACLVGDPEVLVLDEPSSALDPSGRREVLDIIGRLAHTKTVLLSTHILADVQQVCDTVGVIDHGRLLFQGPLADLLAQTTSAFVIHVRSAPVTLEGELASQPWAEQVVELAPDRFRLVVSDAMAAEREIPALLATHGVALASFNPATDLESAFLELTG